MDYNEKSLKLHKKNRGKLEVKSKFPLKTKDDLSVAYTPGVAEPSKKISENTKTVYEYTIKGNSVAVISDGSSVLGLGNIGGEAAMPVMEGKALLFKEFADIDAYPICLTTQDKDEIIKTVKNISAGFGGINLEDIKAPKCFEVESALQNIGIPVFHDDQHGTAIVVRAAVKNAAKVVGKKLSELTVVISGSGAAGIASANLLIPDVANVLLIDSKGIICNRRTDIEGIKKEMLSKTNINNLTGTLKDAMKNSDVFIGVSKAGIVTEDMVKSMNKDSIVLAMANPIPEIMPDLAKASGAKVVGTGRSDFPNQVNNVLAFPGIFRGALDIKAPRINEKMKIAASDALASTLENPTEDMILPSPFDKAVVKNIANAVKNASLT